MRRFLVTGGAGFIGANFVHYILDRYPEDEIVVVDKLTYAGNLMNLESRKDDPRFRFVRADIAEKDEILPVVESADFTHVAHFAAESHVDRSILGPEEFVRTNVMGTFNLLEGFRKIWPSRDPVRRFLHVSTDEVFGSLGEEGLFREDTPYQPNSPYSASKAGSDHLVRAYFHTYGFPVLTTNCSNNYGPYQFPEKLIPLMILNCLNAQPLPIYGEGKNIRDWLYVEDHCSAIDRVIEKGTPGETYNIGARNEQTNIDIVDRICSIMDELHPEGAPHANLKRFVQDRPGHDFRYAIDPQRIETELGWSPAYSFEEALRATARWYLDRRDWLDQVASGAYRSYYEEQYAGRMKGQ